MDIKQVGTISVEELLEKEENNKLAVIKDKDDNKELTKEELREAKKDNRFYLPVLNLNHADMWEPLPKSQRKHFTPEVAFQTCTLNCCGCPGLGAACCRMDPDDLEHVLGPLDEKWIKKALKWFRKKGIELKRHDLVIDYEEGKIIGEKFFNGHKIFEEESSYPILRFQIDGNRFVCKWLNPVTNMCQIYEIRSDMCSRYYCCYIKTHFLVKTPEHPCSFRIVKTKFEDT